MNQSDKAQFAQSFMAVSELYSREITTSLVAMYFEDLSDYSIEQVLAALRSHRRDPVRGSYFPKPADLIEKLNGSSRERGMIAWADVIRLASDSRSAKSDDIVSEAVIAQMGGWRRIGQMDYAQLGWAQKEFIERYQALSKRPELAQQELSRLRGMTPVIKLLTDE